MLKLMTIEALREYVAACRAKGLKIGFVPTMGFLHRGHLSLMTKAKSFNDVVITSIYVNPTQFGEGEDLDSYPRDAERDTALMESVAVDACFFPTDDMMYPAGYQTYIEPRGAMTGVLCGAKRPGHFAGVCTIVAKLFNLVQPDTAAFGLKDAQQVAVIKQMVRDLNIPVTIVPCAIVREDDGLAMSSRNSYLKGEAREQALALRRALDIAEHEVERGARQAADIIAKMKRSIEAYSLARIDYIDIVDFDSLQPIETLNDHVLIALAVYIDGTRLIDNTVLEV